MPENVHLKIFRLVIGVRFVNLRSLIDQKGQHNFIPIIPHLLFFIRIHQLITRK